MENNELYAALALAQSQIPQLKKNATANAGRYGYNYVTLDALIDAVRKPLANNGLSFYQGVESLGDGFCMSTTLAHKSGQSITTVCPMTGNMSDMQKMGSAITYARRYGLQSILGVFAEEDDDGAQTKQARSTPSQPTKIEEKPASDLTAKLKKQLAHLISTNSRIDYKWAMDRLRKLNPSNDKLVEYIVMLKQDKFITFSSEIEER